MPAVEKVEELPANESADSAGKANDLAFRALCAMIKHPSATKPRNLTGTNSEACHCFHRLPQC